jgi:5-methylcytosine-specific restriction protein B
MNTADRSVEALDTALRRRFSFVEMPSKPELLELVSIEDAKEINLTQMLTTINDRIELLIDKDHQIGHSFFINLKKLEELKSVFKNKIIPLLEEYFFGDFGKIGLVLGEAFIDEKKESKVKLAKFTPYEDTSFLTEKKMYQIKNCDNLIAKDFISIYE